jgi:hypothetical protein
MMGASMLGRSLEGVSPEVVVSTRLAGVAEMLPHPPLTRNQVELMKIDTTASERLPGFRALGISPRSLEDQVEAILRQNKQGVLPQ